VSLGNTKGLVRLLCFEPKQEVALHLHPEADEVFYVVKGGAAFVMGEKSTHVQAGSMVKADAGTRHGWKNGLDHLILLSVLMPVSAYHVADQAARMEFV
jgi:quercetin dioxygenase-like cupin family protein